MKNTLVFFKIKDNLFSFSATVRKDLFQITKHSIMHIILIKAVVVKCTRKLESKLKIRQSMFYKCALYDNSVT